MCKGSEACARSVDESGEDKIFGVEGTISNGKLWSSSCGELKIYALTKWKSGGWMKLFIRSIVSYGRKESFGDRRSKQAMGDSCLAAPCRIRHSGRPVE